MISMDPNLVDPDSEVNQRMALYVRVLEKLSIISLNTYKKSPARKLQNVLKAWFEGRRRIKRESFNIITAQDPFVCGIVAYLLAKEFNLPLQLQIHTGVFTPYFWSESLKNKLFVLMAKFLISRADCIRVVSEGIKRYIMETMKLSAPQVSVLPVYVDLDRYLNGKAKVNLHKKYPHFDFIILMACRLFGQKNISLAIRAVRQLSKKYPRLGLLIVGSGPLEGRLKKESEDIRVNVAFESWSDDLVSYYKTADLFLLTSVYEGWARTVIEAMASGTPIIMSDVGLAGEIVENGKNGIVVPVGDEAAVVAAIEDLYRNPKKREMLSKSAYQTIVNLELRYKEKYLKLYEASFRSCIKSE